MSSNGRRRWRKWLARQRKHRESSDGGGREPWCWWRSPTGPGIARRHGGSSIVDGLWNAEGDKYLGELPDLAPLPIPHSAFTARSLVGMSMGSRKRAAYGEIFGTSRWAPEAVDYLPDVKRAVAKARRSYMLGERLRPCPGCNQCGPTIEVDHLVCTACGSDNIGYNTNPDNLPSIGTCAMGSEMTGEPGAEQCNQCDSFDVETEGTMLTKLHTFSLCSGDGLLPARKARKVRG